MKKILLLTLLILTVNVASAQKIRFFTEYFGKPAAFTTTNVRFYYLDAEPVTVKDYTNDTLRMIANIYGIGTPEEADDIIRYYTRRKFIYGLNPKMYKKELQLIRFRDNGQAMHKIKGKNHKLYYEQVWDEEGTGMLRNGSGIYTFFDEHNNQQRTEIYLDSLIVEQFDVRRIQQDTIYHHYDKAAEPMQSMGDFYQRLSSNINYRELVPLAQNDGRVILRFIVTKNGSLAEFKALSGDEEQDLPPRVLKGLNKLPPWKPAIFQGKAVNSMFILPVKVASNR